MTEVLWNVWIRMPWVDNATGNWSLTRSLALYIGYCICEYINKVAKLDMPTVFIVALVLLAAFSKNVSDFRKGVGTILPGGRKSEAMPAITEETATPTSTRKAP